MSALDDIWPQGSPTSLTCRHCERIRVYGPRGGLFCRECDGHALTIAERGGAR